MSGGDIPATHEVAGQVRRMGTTEIRFDTSRRKVVDLTGEVEQFCAGRGDGLCSVFVPHATAGVALMETGSGSEEDLIAALERLLPRDAHYLHRHGARGHGADHLLPVLVSPSVVLPVIDGRVVLGMWQRVVLVDMNSDNVHRRVRLSFVAG
jgi:secondary thiamine-phosphate synthase enzyme